ncbi:hypothetical protein BDR03DRAFT_49083 [Suillus americanus]|nr:hypothetical protein BDR03DRAFT_49083 [Suillus americanus]
MREYRLYRWLARSLQSLAYICVSLATFWAYDYICSFHEEWNFLCRSRWTEVKVLYIIARYVPFLLIITDLYLNFSPNKNPKKCKILIGIYLSCGVISLACSECFFVLRTYAFWNSNRIVLVAMLSTLFATIVTFINIGLRAIVASHVTTSVVPGITGCHRSSPSVEFSMPFLLFFFFQLGLVTLTLIRVFQTWRTSSGGTMHAILVKHNIFYYACGLFLSVLNVLAPVMYPDPAYYGLLGESQVYILAILATRMHLHLWHIGQPAVYDSESVALVSISMSDMPSADRAATTV